MMFMLGEYAAICLMCALTTILFLGGWLPPVDVWFLNWVPGIIWFILKSSMVFFMFAMVKAFVPRYRYDQLMRLGWKVFLPLSLAMVFIVAFTLKLVGGPDAYVPFRKISRRLPGRHVWRLMMAGLSQAVSSLFLKEFVNAFFLSMRYFFAPKATINYPFEKGPLSARVSAASTRCAAIRMAKNAASPASCAKRSVLPRRSPSKLARAATMARAARFVTTSTW
jgi:hypothetical protein